MSQASLCDCRPAAAPRARSNGHSRGLPSRGTQPRELHPPPSRPPTSTRSTTSYSHQTPTTHRLPPHIILPWARTTKAPPPQPRAPHPKSSLLPSGQGAAAFGGGGRQPRSLGPPPDPPQHNSAYARTSQQRHIRQERGTRESLSFARPDYRRRIIHDLLL